MPLHWKELKGVNGTTNSDLLYTYIHFQRKDPDSSTYYDEENRPYIELKSGNNIKNLGAIVCNDIENLFHKKVQFTGNIGLTDGNSTPSDNFTLWRSSNSLIVDYNKAGTQYMRFCENYTGTRHTFCDFGPGWYYLNTGNVEIDTTNEADSSQQHKFWVKSKNFYNQIMDTSGKFQIYNNANTSFIHVALTDDPSYLYRFTSSNFYSANPINALFFNATSDKRAKSNITLLNQSMLDIVKSTPVYTFNYKQNNNTSIGLIAQDLINHQINDFNLIDHQDATGENNDYMSIHESKLVYVLWKAVQELSAQIDELKAQLN